MEFFHHLLHIVSRQISRCFSPCFVKSALSLPSLPPKSAKRQILPTRALLRPPTFFFKKRSSGLTSWNWHDILIAVDGALAQLVAHNTGSVGVRSSNLLCSTILEKSELNPGWGWVRISSFYQRNWRYTIKNGIAENIGFRTSSLLPKIARKKQEYGRGVWAGSC